MEPRLEFNSTLEEYDTADNSTSSNFPSDFNWGLFYLIGLAFIFIAIIIAVSRIRNKTTRMIWMKNLMLQVFQVLSQTPTYNQESQTFNQEFQPLNQESQTRHLTITVFQKTHRRYESLLIRSCYLFFVGFQHHRYFLAPDFLLALLF